MGSSNEGQQREWARPIWMPLCLAGVQCGRSFNQEDCFLLHSTVSSAEGAGRGEGAQPTAGADTECEMLLLLLWVKAFCVLAFG